MVNDINFWLALITGFCSFFIFPAKIRAPVIAFISYAYLFSLDGSVLNGNNSFDSSLLFSKNRIALLLLIGWALLFYYLPKYKNHLGRLQKHTTAILIISIVAYLAWFKYLPALISYVGGKPLDKHIIIPLGISYFTFKLIHYAIENSRGNFKPHSFGLFFTWLSLFTIFTAGPIERFEHFYSNQQSKVTKEDVAEGLTRIIYGLIKKFVIGGIILTSFLNGYTISEVVTNLNELSTYKVWGFLVISFLIIYMDFSAYSDIAIGSSRLLGFRIMENFNWPIFATNISMFWKRWHMTLANWCQSYVYMYTIGVTRNPYMAVYSTFLVMGLWHAGALNWIAWGLYQATGIVVFMRWSKYKRMNKITLFNHKVFTFFALIMTMLFMSGSFAFTLTHQVGELDELINALKIIAKLFFINI